MPVSVPEHNFKLITVRRAPASPTLVVSLLTENVWWQVFPNGQAFNLLPPARVPVDGDYVLINLYRDARAQEYVDGEVLYVTPDEVRANAIAVELSICGVCVSIKKHPEEFENDHDA